MSIGAGIVHGAAQGQLIGTALATARNLKEWQAAYNKLVNRYNELSEKFDKLAGLYEDAKGRRDEYAGMIEELNETIKELNSTVYSMAAERTKSYDFIVDLSKELRKFDPENNALTNPNSILSEVNFYSANRLRDASKRVASEKASNTISEFSRYKSKDELDLQAEKKSERANKYKRDADKGILEVDPSITPRA